MGILSPKVEVKPEDKYYCNGYPYDYQKSVKSHLVYNPKQLFYGRVLSIYFSSACEREDFNMLHPLNPTIPGLWGKDKPNSDVLGQITICLLL